jgi:hypothetical protein
MFFQIIKRIPRRIGPFGTLDSGMRLQSSSLPVSRAFLCAGFLSLALTAAAQGQDAAQEDSASVVTISRVISSSTPLMKNDSLIYHLDLIFARFPSKFWSYADSANHTSTIEVFGSEVKAPEINLPGSCPITKIQVKSRSTKMALTGQGSTITFTVEPGWNVDIAQQDSNDIHLTIGKRMETHEITEVFGKKIR